MIVVKILALDQATKKSGYSFFINGKLKTYGTIEVDVNEKNSIERMCQMGEKIKDVINKLNPDCVVFEHCQYQKLRGVNVFRMLSQMQGILFEILFVKDIGFKIIEPSAWKSFCGINAKKREEQKVLTQSFIKEKFKVSVDEDTADAISIGWWAVNHIKEEKR